MPKREGKIGLFILAQFHRGILFLVRAAAKNGLDVGLTDIKHQKQFIQLVHFWGW
jgi:hypothetical protein